MAIIYDNYIWKITTEAPQPVFSLSLPKDLQWTDEFNWSPVGQNTEFSLTGALLVQEGVKQKGREITLSGLDNMAWITRETAAVLMSMRNTPGLIMTLQFLDYYNVANVLHSFNVIFRQSEGALDLKPIKQWDQFEPGAFKIINSIKFMEYLAYGA